MTAVAALAALAPEVTAAQDAAVPTAPLVLDLDNDGIEFLDPDNFGVFFDMDADGFAEMTGWIGPDDGFLLLDSNGNGAVDGLGELLGRGVPWTILGLYEELQRGRLATGFKMLRSWDGNQDGRIDQADAIFAQLRVWRDLDGDGVSRTEELQTLAQAGVAALLTPSTEGVLSFGRNVVCDNGFYSLADGSQRSLASVRLDYNAQFTKFLGPTVESPETADLPNLVGYGDAKGLRAAMSEDPELLRLVSELTALRIGDAQNLEVQVEQILYRWYRADDVSPSSRGRYIDARHLTALERMQGTPWRSEIGSPEPGAAEAAEINAEWGNYVAYRMVRLLAQIPLGERLIPGVRYEALAFVVLPKGATLDGMLANMRQQAPAGEKAKIRYWRGMAQLLYAMFPEFKKDLPADRQETFEDEFTATIDAVLVGEGVPYGYEQLRHAMFNRSGTLVIQ
jgi:hypothetical protein